MWPEAGVVWQEALPEGEHAFVAQDGGHHGQLTLTFGSVLNSGMKNTILKKYILAQYEALLSNNSVRKYIKPT